MKLFKALFSGWFMGVLLLVFAYVIGYATFVENDYGAVGAKYVVYNTRWFEIILFLMVVNFTGMIFTKKLYVKAKWNILLIHVALVVIIVGAGVTRYYGYEGQMHIRNEQTSNIFTSTDTYLKVQVQKGDEQLEQSDKVLLTNARKNIFSKKYKTENGTLDVTVAAYMPNAAETLMKAETGDAYLRIAIGGNQSRQEFFLKEGSQKIFYDGGISFGDTSRSDFVQLMQQNGEVLIRMPKDVRDSDTNVSSGFVPIKLLENFQIGEMSFAVKELMPHGKIAYTEMPEESQTGKAIINLTVNSQEVFLPFGQETTISVDGIVATLSVKYVTMELPFSLKLNKFDIERYPGSNSPSSFASEVTVIDPANNVEMPYRIYMNHILNYGGYRFFQSSYDQDQMGTVLSVNHDYWGTNITYVGYFLLFASLLMSFFTKKTRFARITQQLKDVHEKRKNLTLTVVFVMASLLGGNAINAQTSAEYEEHAKSFGMLYLQNKEGRIEPVNTMANKVLVKISKKASYKGMSADAVFLGMVTNSEKWRNEALIKVPEESVQKVLGISGDQAAFYDFINERGQYKISADVEAAYMKKPALRSTHDKALINVDERVNVLYMVLNGSVLKILPLQKDPNNTWVTPNDFSKLIHNNVEISSAFSKYILSLATAAKSGNYSEADANLARLRAYQQKEGGAILPNPTKAKLEVFYNETNIFKTLFPFYLTFGVILVGLFFISTFKPTLEFKILNKVFLGVLIIAFIAQTAGLAIRWYISGHAPWSNGYESMIYISWATMLAGFVFMKRSRITLGVTSLLAGITLLTAHMSWLNPELTNLVPVLKSYWLTIHVATITASYGFLGLGATVAFLNMCMMIFRNKKNITRVELTLKELNLIIEMSISVGLVLLVIGNFLGGIWANESWGRYWGWDPKETWTLVTIMLYTFTLHLTLIPAIRNPFTFSFMSFLSFGAVLMTYFGVNYYLSGLHSYAAGDPIAIPSFVFYALGVVALISLAAAYNEFVVKKRILPTGNAKAGKTKSKHN